MKSFKFWLLIFLTVDGLSAGNSQKGRVTTPENMPLGGVKVMTRHESTSTKPDGTFALEKAADLIVFQKEGFRPEVIIPKDPQAPILVKLLPANEAEWKIPACSNISGKMYRRTLGGNLRLVAPEGSFYNRRLDYDYSDFYISPTKSVSKTYIFWILGGPYASSCIPSEEMIRDSLKVQVRSWHSADASGLDIKGRSNDGKYWRELGIHCAGFSFQTESISYKGASSPLQSLY